MYLKRKIEGLALTYASQFKAIAITGARQVGKTSLCRHLFADKAYVNFESADIQLYANTDPRSFLDNYTAQGAIFDEIHRVPQIMNYLQEILDNQQERGKFVFTGSSNLLLNQRITQSLAGRVGYLDMYSFAMNEMPDIEQKDLDTLLFAGGYPDVSIGNISPENYFPSYVQSFVERDVRQTINIKNVLLFQQFLKLSATRTACEWNHSLIAMELGFDSKTAAEWLGMLSTLGIVTLLPPYYSNFGKRVIRKPKLLFNDTGMVCYLLGIRNKTHLNNHPLRGPLFENFVIMDIIKMNSFYNKKANFYFFRTSDGLEVDLIMEINNKLIPIEIKSGKTFNPNYTRNIVKWKNLTKSTEKAKIIYSGESVSNILEGIDLVNFKEIECLFRAC